MKFLYILLSMVLYSVQSLAQVSTAKIEISKAEAETESFYSTRGARLSIVSPSLKLKDGSSDSKGFYPFGFSLGYASLPVRELGWIANVSFLNGKLDGKAVELQRFDANLAYAFTPVMHLKTGGNYSRLNGIKGVVEMKPAVGFQAALGFQLSRSLGLDLGYTQMYQKATVDGAEAALNESGPEFALHGTF